ncbi:MAG: hypothetical protein R2685_01060 [Candidatus Nitrosocosmicus sp.]|nr:hypothetical protein [Candidatus Nitrosocosmicus sp.]
MTNLLYLLFTIFNFLIMALTAINDSTIFISQPSKIFMFLLWVATESVQDTELKEIMISPLGTRKGRKDVLLAIFS